MSVTPYIDAATATTSYFATERLVTAAWDSASSTLQTKALVEATRLIDRLNYAGWKSDPAQANQFPRSNDTLVPQDVKDACCEIAYSLLDDVDIDMEAENNQFTSQGVGDARISRDTSFGLEHKIKGIPSLRAWAMLKPYFRDDKEVNLERV